MDKSHKGNSKKSMAKRKEGKHQDCNHAAKYHEKKRSQNRTKIMQHDIKQKHRSNNNTTTDTAD